MIIDTVWDIVISVDTGISKMYEFDSRTHSLIIQEKDKRGAYSYAGLIGATINIGNASVAGIRISISKNTEPVFSGTPSAFVSDASTIDFECLLNNDFNKKWSWVGTYNNVYFPEINNI